MEKICWANSSYEDSDIVIVGIPDESESHSVRAGSSKAPEQIRKISNRLDSYTRGGKTSLGYPINGISKNVFDYGDITKYQISEIINKIISENKIPISIGGDHSISRLIIKQIAQKVNNISLVYFDAHPDFITSTKKYYGSTFGDVLQHIDTRTSVQIGTRTPEKEEIENLENNQISIITPLDIAEKGIVNISQQILNKIGDSVYISFDMDCIDPAHAPGVSVPVPMGISSVDAMFLIKKIVKRRTIGIDFVEVCPPYDVNHITSHLASRMIIEAISSIK